MNTLQVNHKDKNIQVPVSEFGIHLILIGYDDEVDLYLSSSNIVDEKIWYKTRLEKGNSIIVSLIDQDTNSEPIEVTMKTDDELLNEYQSLKEILKEQKLI